MRFLYLASLCIPLSIWSEQKMVYQSSTEGVHIQTEWVVDHQQEPIGIVGKNRGNDIQLKYFSFVFFTALRRNRIYSESF